MTFIFHQKRYDAARGRQFTELGLVEALQNVTWMRGYEFFQGYGWSEGIGESVANMINETAHGVLLRAVGLCVIIIHRFTPTFRSIYMAYDPPLE